MRIFNQSLFFIGIIAIALQCDGYGQERTWTDQSGSHKRTATLSEILVVLERTDGTLVTVPLRRLSPADQVFVRNQIGTDPIQGEIATPAAEELCRQIVASLKHADPASKRSIAILDLRRIDGAEIQDGRKLAEELITQLHLSGSFTIQERSNLTAIMKEHQLASDGLVDPNSAKRLGELLGVDYILTGTICDRDGLRAINVRLISSQTGMISAVASVGASPLGDLAEATAKAVLDSLTQSNDQNVKRIGVLGFVGLDNEVEPYCEILTEELVCKLFLVGKCDVAERQLLSQVLREHKLNESGLIDGATAQSLGQFLAVDGVVTGSLKRKGNKITVNARVVTVESGTVVAVAERGVHVERSETINNSLPDGYFLREHFNNLKPGEIPLGWQGDTMGVQVVGKAKVLKNMSDKGSHILHTAELEFPEDFEIVCVLRTPTVIGGVLVNSSVDYSIRVGDAHLQFHLSRINGTTIRINDSTEDVLDVHEFSDSVVVISLRKQGALFTPVLNGRELSTVRIADFKKPERLTIAASSEIGRSDWTFIVTQVEGKIIE